MENQPQTKDRQSRVLQRRLQIILRRRILHLDVTIYQGGFVKIEELLEQAPVLKRFNYTIDQLKEFVADNSSIFLIQDDYIKVLEGHKFDVTDAKYEALPSND